MLSPPRAQPYCPTPNDLSLSQQLQMENTQFWHTVMCLADTCLRSILQSERSLFPPLLFFHTHPLDFFVSTTGWNPGPTDFLFSFSHKMSFIWEVKMPTFNVTISTPYSFKVKHFLALPSQPQAQTCFRLGFSFFPNSVVHEAREERESGGRAQFYLTNIIAFPYWFFLDVDFFTSGIHIHTGFLGNLSLALWHTIPKANHAGLLPYH